MNTLPLYEKRPGRKRWVVLILLIGVVLVVYRYEFGLVLKWGMHLAGLSGGQPGKIPSGVETLQIMLLPGMILVSGALLVSGFFLISRFILPVRNFDEQKKAAERLLYHLSPFRRTVIFVRDGKQTTSGKVRQRAPGVALVDLNSAIVLERQWMPLASSPMGGVEETDRLQGVSRAKRPFAHVEGYGPVFIKRYERVRGVVSLRKQFRINLDVLGCSSDGIEVKTHIFSIFTLGQPPSVLKVAYIGGRELEDLRVLHIDEKTGVIKAITDDLDLEDKGEIHRFVQQYRANPKPSVDLVPEDRSKEYPPYLVDERRILAAIYSRAQDVNNSNLEEWSDLPPMVATEVFRNLISGVTYDSLFVSDDPEKYPLKDDFKPKFTHTMRNLGVLAYQFVARRDGLDPYKGQRVDKTHFYIAPDRELRTPKVLRERGIKIIYAGFTELKAVDPAVHQQRLENWQARWQRDTELEKANYDLEVIRVRNRARADAQREMIFNLSNLFHAAPHSQEALALRVYQALETAAAEPATRQLLPRDTIHMLRSLRYWLLPEEVKPTQVLGEDFQLFGSDGEFDES